MVLIKALLFDLDDTLWPIAPVISRAEKLLFDWLRQEVPAVAERYSIDAMRQRRMELMKAEPRYAINLAALRHAVMTELFAACGADVSRVDAAMDVFSTARNEVDLYPDVHPALSALSQRLLLGSVSNGVADLQAIGLAHYFRASIAAHRFGTTKPDPAIFQAGCAALGVAPEETVYIGDDLLIDVEGAQKAGLRAVWMRRSETLLPHNMPDHVRPDAVCRTLHELEQWLDGSMMVPPPTSQE